jgi:hypothetical protein
MITSKLFKLAILIILQIHRFYKDSVGPLPQKMVKDSVKLVQTKSVSN